MLTTTARSTASISTNRSPTRTPPATWPCSRRSATRSPSTPRPGSSAIARRRGWLVEHWAKAAGGRPAAPPRPSGRWASSGRALDVVGTRQRRASGGGADEGAPLRAEPAPVRGGRLASALGSGRGAAAWARCGWSTSTLPPPGTVPGTAVRPRAVGHLRLGPGHHGRPQLALLRDAGQLPVRPRPRGRRHARGRRTRGRRVAAPDGARVVIEPVLGCRARGIEPPCACVCRGTHRRLRAGRLRAHPPGHPDRLLRRHRRRMVDRGPGRPREPAVRGARRAERRGRGHRRAARLRPPRGLGAGSVRRGHRGGDRGRDARA